VAQGKKRRGDTRRQIIKVGAKHFTEDGYTKTTMKRISRELDLSPGNITFYFPTKEHLLAVLLEEMFDFQSLMIEKALSEEKNGILVYGAELAVIAGMCAEDAVIKEFFISAYTSPHTLDLIRKKNTEQTRTLFGNFCKGFSEEDWVTAEVLASGMEYGVITRCEKNAALSPLLRKALHARLALYGVPESLCEWHTERVLSLDYKALGRRILAEFRAYLDRINETET